MAITKITPVIVSKKSVTPKKAYITPKITVKDLTNENAEKELPKVFENFGKFMSDLSVAIIYMVHT